MNRTQLNTRLTALGVTESRAERLGVSLRYLRAAVCGYRNVESVDQKDRVSAIVAGNIKGLENVFLMENWRKMSAEKWDSALDDFFKRWVPAAQKLAEKASKRSSKWQRAARKSAAK